MFAVIGSNILAYGSLGFQFIARARGSGMRVSRCMLNSVVPGTASDVMMRDSISLYEFDHKLTRLIQEDSAVCQNTPAHFMR